MVVPLPPLIGLVVYVIVGAYYREKLKTKYRHDVASFDSLRNLRTSVSDFDSGLFDCFNGRKAVRKCCFACFCPPVRWSADASATGFMDFWLALVLSSIFVTFIFIFGFIGRIHIRSQYNMVKRPVRDCLSWWCCYSCALTQEAKFIDKGFRAIRDGATSIQLDAPIPIAAIVEKREPSRTPETATPPTPSGPESHQA